MNADSLRVILVASRRWQRVCEGLDLMTIVGAGPVDLDDLRQVERDEIFHWAAGADMPMPKALADYVRSVGGTP